MESLLFTPASLLDLLSKIDELSEYDLGVTTTLDGDLQLQVGDSTYLIDSTEAEDIEVDDSVVDEVYDLNLATYEDLGDSEDISVEISEDEVVESGILKELAKTLLVGGLVRLSSKVLFGKGK